MSARLAALCFGNFVIGTGTLVVPGMLPALAEGLSVSLPVAGQLVSAFAFAVCIGAPLLAAATSRIERRRLLVAMMLLYAGGHLAAAAVSSFVPMLAVRIFTSAGAAVFTAQAAATAALLVPPERRAGAISFVFLGWALAAVAGVSAGAYVSEVLGWRAGFLLVAALSIAGAILVAASVPRGLHITPIDWRMARAIGRQPVFLAILAVTALQSAPQFAILAFIVPATMAFLGNPGAGTVGLVLTYFGALGVAGNLVAARCIDRAGAAAVALAAMLAMAASHLLWPFAAGSLGLFLVVLTLWGLGCFAANGAQQARLAALAPREAPVLVALNTSALYLGQAAGPVLGGVILAQVGGLAGYRLLAAASLPLFALAVGLSLYASRMRPSAARAGVPG